MSSRGGAAGTPDAFKENPGPPGDDDRVSEDGVVYPPEVALSNRVNMYPPEMALSNRRAHSTVSYGESSRRGWTLTSDGWWEVRHPDEQSVWSWLSFKLTAGRQQKLRGAQLLMHDSSDDVGAMLLRLSSHITLLKVRLRFWESDEELGKLCTIIFNAAPSTLTSLRLEGRLSHAIRDGRCKEIIRSLTQAMKARNLTGIKSFALVGVHLDSQDIQSLANVIKDGWGQSLSELSLDNCNGISQHGHEVLAQLMEAGHMRSLEILNLRRTGIGEACCEGYGKAVRTGNLSSLKNLDLSVNDMRRGHVDLASGMASRGMPALEHLRLDKTGLEEDGCNAYGKACSSGSFPALKYFNLSCNKEMRSGHVVLAMGMEFGGMPVLESLHLEGSGMEKERCEAYGKAMSAGSLPVLEKLVLFENALGDVGGIGIGMACISSEVKSLKEVDLEGTQLEDDGMQAMATSFQAGGLPNLERLLLGRNKFTERGLLALTMVLTGGHLNSLKHLCMTSNEKIQTKNWPSSRPWLETMFSMLTLNLSGINSPIYMV